VETTIKLEELRSAIRTCTSCRLHANRQIGVPGEGPCPCDLMAIGEAPGAVEDSNGKPFQGPSGNFLNELLQSIGLDRSQIFITNIVKCKPPLQGGTIRVPFPDEADACAHWLNLQIELVNPKLVILIGGTALQRFMAGRSGIMKVRGQPVVVEGRTFLPVLHPAAALHNSSMRPLVWEDFRKIPSILEQAQVAVREPEVSRPALFDVGG